MRGENYVGAFSRVGIGSGHSGLPVQMDEITEFRMRGGRLAAPRFMDPVSAPNGLTATR